MLRTSTWLVALWIGVCSASGQEATSADDLRKGHQLATMVCGFCHVAAPDQARMPILDPPAPSFESLLLNVRMSLPIGWKSLYLQRIEAWIIHVGCLIRRCLTIK